MATLKTGLKLGLVAGANLFGLSPTLKKVAKSKTWPSNQPDLSLDKHDSYKGHADLAGPFFIASIMKA